MMCMVRQINVATFIGYMYYREMIDSLNHYVYTYVVYLH